MRARATAREKSPLPMTRPPAGRLIMLRGYIQNRGGLTPPLPTMDTENVDLPNRGRSQSDGGRQKDQRITVRVSSELDEKVEQHADERDMTPSEFVRTALDNLLDEDHDEKPEIAGW